MKCYKHPHSSDETAIACYQDTMQKQADRKIKRVLNTVQPKYRQIKVEPPKVIEGCITKITMFYTAETY